MRAWLVSCHQAMPSTTTFLKQIRYFREYFPRKLFFFEFCLMHKSAETIQGRKLFAELRYSIFKTRPVKIHLVKFNLKIWSTFSEDGPSTHLPVSPSNRHWWKGHSIQSPTTLPPAVTSAPKCWKIIYIRNFIQSHHHYKGKRILAGGSSNSLTSLTHQTITSDKNIQSSKNY